MASFIGRFDITCVIQKFLEGQAIKDYLAKNPIEGYQPMTDSFKDEMILSNAPEEEYFHLADVFWWGCKYTRDGIGAIQISPTRPHYPVAIKLRFLCTNNMAEYEACIVDLEAALDINVKDLEVYGDSILIISRSIGENKPTASQIQQVFHQSATPFARYPSFTCHVRRINLSMSWRLMSSILKISKETNLCVETHDHPVYCYNVEPSRTVIHSTMIIRHSWRMVVILNQLTLPIKEHWGNWLIVSSWMEEFYAKSRMMTFYSGQWMPLRRTKFWARYAGDNADLIWVHLCWLQKC